MIARLWRGHTRAEDAAAYTAFLEARAFPDYRAIEGNRGVVLLKNTGETTAEFVLISTWESFDAIRHFAGPEVERAVYYPEDDHFLLGREPRVTHYEVSVAPGGAGDAREDLHGFEKSSVPGGVAAAAPR